MWRETELEPEVEVGSGKREPLKLDPLIQYLLGVYNVPSSVPGHHAYSGEQDSLCCKELTLVGGTESEQANTNKVISGAVSAGMKIK